MVSTDWLTCRFKRKTNRLWHSYNSFSLLTMYVECRMYVEIPMLSLQTLVVKILKSQLCIMSVFSQTLCGTSYQCSIHKVHCKNGKLVIKKFGFLLSFIHVMYLIQVCDVQGAQYCRSYYREITWWKGINGHYWYCDIKLTAQITVFTLYFIHQRTNVNGGFWGRNWKWECRYPIS